MSAAVYELTLKLNTTAKVAWDDTLWAKDVYQEEKEECFCTDWAVSLCFCHWVDCLQELLQTLLRWTMWGCTVCMWRVFPKLENEVKCLEGGECDKEFSVWLQLVSTKRSAKTKQILIKVWSFLRNLHLYFYWFWDDFGS